MFIYEPCLDRRNEGCNTLEVEYMFQIKHVSKAGKRGVLGQNTPFPDIFCFMTCITHPNFMRFGDFCLKSIWD